MIALSLGIALFAAAQHVEVAVGIDGADDPRALQAAVDRVAALGGGTVRIGPGRYLLRNALVLRSRVNVVGTPGKTVLAACDGVKSRLACDGDCNERQITLADPAGFRVGDGVAIRDDRSGGGFAVTTATLTAQVDANTFRISAPLYLDYMISQKATAALSFPVVGGWGVKDVSIEGITIEGNREKTERLDGCRGGGLYLFECEGIAIRACTVRGYNGDGISFQVSDRVTVEECLAEGNTGLGLHPGSGSQRPVMRFNRSLGNGGDGLYVCWRVKHGLFENNEVRGNLGAGISIGHKDTDNLFHGNVVADNVRTGVLFRDETEPMGAHRNVFEGNTILDNGLGRGGKFPQGGVILQGCHHDVVFRDNAIGNTRAGGPAGGPVGISADHRHFVDRDGAPCFWLGDTQWELFHSFKEEDAEAVLEDRRAKGFNAIQIMLLGVGGGKKPNAYGAKPFLNDDVSTPNEAYFSVVDSIVRRAARKGLVLVIGLYHKSPGYGTMITKENARAWGEWVGRRYRGASNVIWSMYPVANASYVPIVRELAAGLTQGDGGAHLITVHPDPSPASSSWIHEEPWLSFNTLQSWVSTSLNYKMVAADYARTPVKPAVNGEARYEEEGGTTPLLVRRGAWWSCLAGGFYSYGHGGNWMKPADWKVWLDSPGSRQMKILADFFRSLDWWTLVPDPSVLSAPSGEAVAARSSDRRWALVYLPTRAPVTISMTAVESASGAEVSWFNPATGFSQPAGVFPSSGTPSFTPPEGWPDAVLLIRAKTR